MYERINNLVKHNFIHTNIPSDFGSELIDTYLSVKNSLKSFRQAKKCAKQNIVLFYSSAKSSSETHFKEQNSTIYTVFKTSFYRHNIFKISYSFTIVYGRRNMVWKY